MLKSNEILYFSQGTIFFSWGKCYITFHFNRICTEFHKTFHEGRTYEIPDYDHDVQRKKEFQQFSADLSTGNAEQKLQLINSACARKIIIPVGLDPL